MVVTSVQNSEALRIIRLASRGGYTASADVVPKLLKAEWCEANDLSSAYLLLAESNESKAVVFFQLPYAVRVSTDWLPVAWEHGAPCFSLDARRPSLIERSRRNVRNSLENQLEHQEVPRPFTQVRIAFTVWGRRARFYSAYLAEISSSHRHSRKHLVSSTLSWLSDARPLTAETYESDLASRLYHESIRIMQRVIKTYSILCRDAYAEGPTHLPNFFMMARNGRIVVRPRTDSWESGQDGQISNTRVASAKDLVDALRSGTAFSDYERFLVDAIRHVDSGNANLAVVQAVMILDWFANTILYDRIVKPLAQRLHQTPELSNFVISNIWEIKYKKRRRTRVSTVDKFEYYLPLSGFTLESKLFEALKGIIQLRNQIVHKEQSKPVEKEIALNTLETAMAVVRSVMMQMKIAADMGQLE